MKTLFEKVEQPPIKGGRSVGFSNFKAGAKRSQARLAYLDFDPIGELVKQYRKLELEIEYQEKIRSKEIVELTSTGREKAYRPEVHHALYDKLNKIGEALLRYGYGRVPETTIVEEKRPLPLIVNLTKKGEQYVINQDDTESIEYDDETDNFFDN